MQDLSFVLGASNELKLAQGLAGNAKNAQWPY